MSRIFQNGGVVQAMIWPISSQEINFHFRNMVKKKWDGVSDYILANIPQDVIFHSRERRKFQPRTTPGISVMFGILYGLEVIGLLTEIANYLLLNAGKRKAWYILSYYTGEETYLFWAMETYTCFLTWSSPQFIWYQSWFIWNLNKKLQFS